MYDQRNMINDDPPEYRGGNQSHHQKINKMQCYASTNAMLNCNLMDFANYLKNRQQSMNKNELRYKHFL